MIPKTIHQVWLGGNLPTRFAEFIASWRRLHPEWGYHLWTDADRPELGVNEDLYERASSTVEEDRVGQFRADLVRLELLRRHGGVYVDVDMECIRPIDVLVEGHECFFGWEKEGIWINNAVCGAVPLHPFIVRLVASVGDNVRRRRGRPPNWLTGPKYITPMFELYGRELGATVFPQATFYPYAWNELDRGSESFPDSYAVHHWDNQRKLKGKAL